MLKEAENTINVYVRKLEKETKIKSDRRFRLKYEFLKICNIMLILTVVTIALVLL